MFDILLVLLRSALDHIHMYFALYKYTFIIYIFVNGASVFVNDDSSVVYGASVFVYSAPVLVYGASIFVINL